MSTLPKDYKPLRKAHPNTLLLFRMGDFYEAYESDAKKLETILGVTLTLRDGIHMAGFPHHALDTYLPKLIREGLRVAISNDDLPTEKISRKKADEPPTDEEGFAEAEEITDIKEREFDSTSDWEYLTEFAVRQYSKEELDKLVELDLSDDGGKSFQQYVDEQEVILEDIICEFCVTHGIRIESFFETRSVSNLACHISDRWAQDKS